MLVAHRGERPGTYEVCQMDMAIRIEQHVIGFDIPMHYALLVDVADGAAKLCYPKPHRLFRKRLPRNVEAKIATIHQVDHDVAIGYQHGSRMDRVPETYRYSMSWKLYRRLQRKGWFRCSSIRRSRMILRTLSDRTTVTRRQHRGPGESCCREG